MLLGFRLKPCGIYKRHSTFVGPKLSFLSPFNHQTVDTFAKLFVLLGTDFYLISKSFTLYMYSLIIGICFQRKSHVSFLVQFSKVSSSPSHPDILGSPEWLILPLQPSKPVSSLWSIFCLIFFSLCWKLTGFLREK